MSFRRIPGMRGGGGRGGRMGGAFGGGSQWRLERGMLWIIILSGAVFLVYAFLQPAQGWMTRHLALTPRALRGLELWQLASALFMHVSPGSFLLDMVFLWLMGSFIERALGRRAAVLLLLGTGVIGYLGAAVVALVRNDHGTYTGIEPSLFAMMAATGFIYGRTQVLFFGAVPARADVISWIFVGFWLLRRVFGIVSGEQQELTLLASDLAAGGAAWVMIRRAGSRLSLRSLQLRLDRVRLWWLRRRYKVLEGGKGKSENEKKWMN